MPGVDLRVARKADAPIRQKAVALPTTAGDEGCVKTRVFPAGRFGLHSATVLLGRWHCLSQPTVASHFPASFFTREAAGKPFTLGHSYASSSAPPRGLPSVRTFRSLLACEPGAGRSDALPVAAMSHSTGASSHQHPWSLGETFIDEPGRSHHRILSGQIVGQRPHMRRAEIKSSSDTGIDHQPRVLARLLQ